LKVLDLPLAKIMTLDERMNRFRLGSRELFNHFFHVPAATDEASALPAGTSSAYNDEACDMEARFSDVEAVLFEKLVIEPAQLNQVEYKDPHPQIVVKLNSKQCPVMLNREVSSGYWDFPIREVTDDARLLFIRFFDFDVLSYRDNRYVWVQVDDWPSRPETAGKHALVETQYVHFVVASSTSQPTTT
jgi:hypothetical protein